MTLYETLKAAGCEIDSHKSDLYVRDTPKALEILKEYGREKDSRFRSQLDGSIWIDVPFHYDPFCEGKGFNVNRARVVPSGE